MTTKNMKTFIEKNKTHKVFFGERRTPDNRPALNAEELAKSDRILYQFVDGTSMTITTEDINSAPDFTPSWEGV